MTVHSFSPAEAVAERQPVLTEGAVLERLRRHFSVPLDPHVAHALLIRSSRGRSALQSIYEDYLRLAHGHHLPILLGTPTWRASRRRLAAAGVKDDINAEAVAWLNSICRPWLEKGAQIAIAGMMGPDGDCYRSDQAPDAKTAESEAAWQARRLADAGADLLVAATLPAVDEARGMARAMVAAGLPCVISFVIDRQGRVLDRTPLAEAIRAVDAVVNPKPVGYMVNCAYPSFLRSISSESLNHRLIGCQANGSDLDHDQLDAADELHQVPIRQWVGDLLALRRNFGLSFIGGCCGTGPDHIRVLAGRIREKQ